MVMKQRRQAFGFITTAAAAFISSVALVLVAGFSGANATTDSATPSATSSSTPSATGAPDASIPPGQDRYLVTTSPSATQAIASQVTDAGGFVTAQYDKSMTGFVATMTAQTATTLAQTAGVKFVERDGVVQASARALSTANDNVAGGAVVSDLGCLTNSLPAGDDISSGSISFGMSANWFGTSYTKLFVNNNGGIAFDDGRGAFTDYTHNITSSTRPIILPMGTDVDTTLSTKRVTYGPLTDTIGGHAGFCVNYVQVGHYGNVATQPYTSQLILVDRSDRRAGDIDIIFNYNTMSAAMSSYPLEVGYANPTDRTKSFRMTGSNTASTLLDGGSAALNTNKTDLIESSASVYTSKNGRYAYGITNSAAPTATPTPSNTPTPTATPTAGCLTPVPAGTQGCATWGLDRIDQLTANLDGLFTPAGTGSGVVAYVVDTGIYAAHSDFTGRISSGYTAISDGNGTNDCNGHGTHVAGTIGGTTYGVAKQVTLVPVRVLGCTGSGSTSGVIAGIDWAITHHASGPAVLNMSLGGGYSKTLNDAVVAAVADGITVVVAAGNSSVNACDSSPASEATAITVGATSSNDARASFSNYGSCVDLFAPGVNITSAGISGTTSASTFSGTSMASPHVAGAAAVYLGLRSSAT
ncbi:MAG: S8 family serine peptidase, partial [Actinobacteria bacterium]|nr:S8 family serine peptidase [Actinomycetota bacterium]